MSLLFRLTILHITGGCIDAEEKGDQFYRSEPSLEFHGPPIGFCLLHTMQSLESIELSYIAQVSRVALASLAACINLR